MCVCCWNVRIYTSHNILFTLCEIWFGPCSCHSFTPFRPEARVQLRFRWFLSIKKKRKSKRALTLDSLCTWQELFSTTKNNRLLNTMLYQMLCKKRAWARLCLVLWYLTWRHDHTGLFAYAPPSLPSHLLPLLYFSLFFFFWGPLTLFMLGSFWYFCSKSM